MDELVPNKNKFENALAENEEASKENQQLPDLKIFKEKGGLFSLFPKNVTGAEMNDFAIRVQDILIDANERINKAYKRLADFYTALEGRDKEYSARIEEAFNEAVKAIKKAEDAQKDVNNTIQLLNDVVEKINEFNKKVDAEFCRLDSDDWREKALNYQEGNTNGKSIDSYEERYHELVNRLEEEKRERIRNTRNLVVCWVTTGIALVVTITLILLIVFHVI